MYKRFLSYIFPLRIEKASSVHNPFLELNLSRGQWQLATDDAIYSDGHHYRPLVEAFRVVGNKLTDYKHVLVLGAGLGSAAQILHRMGIHPRMTMVDNDPVILGWLARCIGSPTEEAELICRDAGEYIFTSEARCDMLIVDLFKGRKVPEFVEDAVFLERCRFHVDQGGCLVLNYIVNDNSSWEAFHTSFTRIFPQATLIDLAPNKVFITTV